MIFSFFNQFKNRLLITKKMLAIIKIVRPLNILITFLVVIVAAFICSNEKTLTEKILLAAISASFIAASGNIVNDIFDYNIDLINRSNRPLPANEMTINFAIFLYLFFTCLGLIFAQQVSWESFFIAVFVSLILLLYSFLLKQIPLLGNIAVSVCTALAFIYGGVAVNSWEASIIPAIFAFLINLIREIIKDIEDIEGDEKNNVITFPSKFGIQKTKNVLTFIIIILIGFTFYPFIKEIYSIEYFIIILLTVDLLLVYFIREIKSNMFIYKISTISKLLKLSMIFGLIAIFLGNY